MNCRRRLEASSALALHAAKNRALSAFRNMIFTLAVCVRPGGRPRRFCIGVSPEVFIPKVNALFSVSDKGAICGLQSVLGLGRRQAHPGLSFGVHFFFAAGAAMPPLCVADCTSTTCSCP